MGSEVNRTFHEHTFLMWSYISTSKQVSYKMCTGPNDKRASDLNSAINGFRLKTHLALTRPLNQGDIRGLFVAGEIDLLPVNIVVILVIFLVPIITYFLVEYNYDGLYSLSGKTSYRQILWSLEAAVLDVIMIVSLWNMTGISTALLPRCVSNCKAAWRVDHEFLR